MIPVQINHERVFNLRIVVRAAKKYVNVTPAHSDYEFWEKCLANSELLVERLIAVHVRDAHENGTCERCNADAYHLAQERAEHESELQEFDKLLNVTGKV